MPRPLNVDWSFIQALYLQGLQPSVIQAKTGVLASTVMRRASRKGWAAVKAKAKADLGLPLKAVRDDLSLQVARSHSKALAQASQQAQASFSEEITAQSKVLASQPPRRLADLANSPAREGRASVVSRLVQTAAKLYGWDNQGSAPTHLSLTRIEVRPSPAQPDQAGQVVDVPYEA